MSTGQKTVTVLAGLALAFVLIRPPGYQIYEPGDLGHDPSVLDAEKYFRQKSQISQDWIYEHEEISGKYLSLEIFLISGLWLGGYLIFREESHSAPDPNLEE